MTIVQYLVLNSGVISNWSQGAIIAQACHASVAAIAQSWDSPETQEYISPTNQSCMVKIILKTKDENEFERTASNLKSAGIEHYCWLEQPENLKTCLALMPCRKERALPYLSHLKLQR